MSADALELIESKIAHLERGSLELSDVVFRQQQEIRALESQLRALQVRLATAQPEELGQNAELERPPHY